MLDVTHWNQQISPWQPAYIFPKNFSPQIQNISVMAKIENTGTQHCELTDLLVFAIFFIRWLKIYDMHVSEFLMNMYLLSVCAWKTVNWHQFYIHFHKIVPFMSYTFCTFPAVFSPLILSHAREFPGLAGARLTHSMNVTAVLCMKCFPSQR